MYNTYDVHFYASFSLIQLWPQLEVCCAHYGTEPNASIALYLYLRFADSIHDAVEPTTRHCTMYIDPHTA
jgi:hypothetical protein